MSELAVRPSVLADVFPWLSAGHLQSLPAGEALDVQAVAALCAELLDRHPSRPYGALLPALHGRRDDRIELDQLSTRTSNALRRLGLRTWADILLLRPDDLLSVTNFGRTSLSDLTQLAVTVTSASYRTLVGEGNHDGTPPTADDLTADFDAMSDDQLLAAGTGFLQSIVQTRLTLAELMPGLVDRGYDEVPAGLLPTRIAARLDLSSWDRFIGVTVAELEAMPNIGTQSLSELLVALRQESTRTDGRVGVGLGEASQEVLLASLIEVLSWAEQERGSRLAGEVIGVAPDLQPLPSRIAERWEHLSSAALSPLVVARVAPVVEQLIDQLDDRDRLIMERRAWCIGKGSTLEQVGAELDITRERVRQLESDAKVKIERTLSQRPFDLIRDRWEELRRRIGSAVLAESELYTEATSWAVSDIREDLRPTALGLFLAQAGPYVERDGWIVLAAGAPDPKGAEIRSAADSSGFVSEDTVHKVLGDAGLVPEMFDSWRDRVGHLIRVDDGWLDGSGSLVDLAYRYLAFRGVPMSVEEILAGIRRTDASTRSVRQRLFEDNRFVRVSKSELGLTSWGYDEYTSVPEEMAEEIERCGGSIALDLLVERLVDRYGVAAASVRMYSGRPMFYVDERDTVSMRTDEHPYEVRDDLRLVPSCYELSPSEASWRIRVDHDLLRGSGRHVPEQLAGWLRLRPGDRFDARNPRRPVPLSWRPWAQPDVGSLKGFAEDVGATEGDWLVLVFTRDGDVDVVHVPSTSAPSLDLLASLIGLRVDGAGGAALERVAGVLGIPTGDDSTRFRVRAALERRRDSDLVALFDEAVFS